MFGAKLFVAILFVSSIDCASCKDYGTEGACVYHNQGQPLDCVYDGSQSWGACTTRSILSFCSDFNANQATCEQNNGQIDCAWDWDGTVGSQCQQAVVYDCEYYNLSTEPACTANNGKHDCVYDAADKSCVEKPCRDYTTADTCNARDDCLFDTTCKRVSCGNYSATSEAACHTNPKGLLCKYTGTTCSSAQYCSSFNDNQTYCEQNNGKIDCYWDGTVSSSTKCLSKNTCGYFTSKDSCISNNGAMDCEWLANSNKCNTYTCLSINNNIGDDIPSESACLTNHPSECYWASGKCTSGAKAMSVSSLVMLLLLLFVVHF